MINFLQYWIFTLGATNHFVFGIIVSYKKSISMLLPCAHVQQGKVITLVFLCMYVGMWTKKNRLGPRLKPSNQSLSHNLSFSS